MVSLSPPANPGNRTGLEPSQPAPAHPGCDGLDGHRLPDPASYSPAPQPKSLHEMTVLELCDEAMRLVQWDDDLDRFHAVMFRLRRRLREMEAAR